MCAGASMTGLFTMLLGVAAIFTVANFDPKSIQIKKRSL